MVYFKKTHPHPPKLGLALYSPRCPSHEDVYFKSRIEIYLLIVSLKEVSQLIVSIILQLTNNSVKILDNLSNWPGAVLENGSSRYVCMYCHHKALYNIKYNQF